MPGGLAILALFAVGQAQGGSSVDPRLSAFEQLCLPQRLDPAAMASGFIGAGWAVSDASADPELAAVMKLDQDRTAEAAAESETTVFRRAGLFATVNVVTADIAEDEIARYATCAIWDFDAEAGIPDQQVSAFAGVTPIVRLDRPYGRIVQWSLGEVLPGAGNLQASYFPRNSPASAQTGFTGAAVFLTSDLDVRE